MLRALPLLALLLLFLAAGPPPAAAKRAACAKSQVTVAKACLPRRAIRVETAARTPRARVEQGAKLAPKPRVGGRALKRLRRKVAELSDRVTVRAGIARAGELEIGEDGEIAPVKFGDGASGGGRVRLHEAGEGEVGQGFGMDVEATQRTEGGSLTSGQTYDTSASIAGCPDGGGLVHGDARYVMGQHHRVRLADGRSGSSSWRITADMDIEARVEPDARISTYDRRLVVDVEFRQQDNGRHVPTRRYRAVLNRSGIDSRVERDWKKGVTEADLAGSYRGPRGSRLTFDEAVTLVKFTVLADAFLQHDVSKQLLKAERGWYDDFACATLEVGPAAREIARGASATFTARFRAKDGALADATVQAAPWGGGVDRAGGSSTSAQPFSATFTLAEARGGVDLIATSRRGRAKGRFSAAEPPSGWRVTLTGAGYYARDEEGHGDTDHAEADFHWSAAFATTPLSGTATTAQVTIGGTMLHQGTIHGGSYRCTGTPAPRQRLATLRAEAQPNGDVRVAVAPFAVLVGADQTCVREGYSGGYGRITDVHTGPVYEAVATVTAAQLSQDSFSVPVGRRSGVTFPGTSCFRSLCVESGDWTGVLRFQRG